jgi:hypothetical protein
MKKLKTGLLIVISLVGVAPLLGESRAGQVQTPPTFESTVLPFMQENCAECHNSKTLAGDLDFAVYNTPETVVKSRDVWVRVLKQVRSDQMPPAEMPRPEKDKKEAFIDWLSKELDRTADKGK